MKIRSATMNVLLSSFSGLISALLFSAASHTLQYITAVTPGFSFTSGQLDGEQFVHYNSSNTEVIRKMEWMNQVKANYWKSEKARFSGECEDLQQHVNQAVEASTYTAGVHTLQWMYGCELNDDNNTSGYDQYAYDGEDFISLDLKTGNWTAAKPQALITKWDPDGRYARDRKHYLEGNCITWLNLYLSYSRRTLERKVRPEASVFQKHSSPPEVVCHATGFFPKAVNISWQKDGEDVHEDVELRETLPNQDGSFQKRSVLRVLAEELQKHTYTCVIQHSSLGEELVLPVSERRILSEHRGGGSDGGSDGVKIGVIVAVVVLGLFAVFAGIMIWRRRKKKNSDFRFLPVFTRTEPSEVTSDFLPTSSGTNVYIEGGRE